MKLTDEQIREASLESGMQEHYMGFHSGFIRFARAIESKVLAGITGDGRGEAWMEWTEEEAVTLAKQLGFRRHDGVFGLNQEELAEFLNAAIPPQQEQAAPGAVPDGLQKRAVDLHEKAGMPWAEAEQLALSEAGIEDSHIDELTGNTDHATICSLLSKEEVREFTRTILIYGQPLLSAAPMAVTPDGWLPIETAPKDGTAILLGARGGSWIGKWLPVYQSGFKPDNPWSSLMLNHDHMGEKWLKPTHWKPLAAPKQEPGA